MNSPQTSLLPIQFLMGCICCMLSCSPVSSPEESRPHIIFLLTDDLRHDALGFKGNPYVHTPHLDQLASEATVFSHNYHVSPICMPSRASLMTGQYLGTHQVGFNKPTNFVLTEKEFEQSYPVLLRKSGYFTGFIGKFGFPVRGNQKIPHDAGAPKENALPKDSFDAWMGFPGQGTYFPKGGAFNGYDNFSDAAHLNEFMGDQAIDFLQKAQDTQQPFCLSISFKAPHAPFTPELDMRAVYDSLLIPRMSNDVPAAFDRLPKIVQEKSRNALRYFGKGNRYEPVWHLERDSVYQEFIKNYYGLISGVDRVVGRIREALEKQGLAENTLIIFTSDNGFFCGSRQLTGKALLYDESARAPLILYDPRQESRPAQIHHLVSQIDIAPTLLRYAGIDPPLTMPGLPLQGLFLEPKTPLHEATFGENNFANGLPTRAEAPDPEGYQSMRSRFVRTSKYKYIRYYESQPMIEELWDMEADPGETVNLLYDSNYKDILEEMRGRLNDFEERFVLSR